MKLIITEEQSEKLNHKVKTMVNKYGFDETLRLFDNNIDVIKRAYEDNPLEFLDQFNDLRPIEKYDKIFYMDKDRLPLFYYYLDDNNGYVYINYERIWMFFYVVFEFETPEIKDILKNWLEETYNIRGLKPAEVLTVSLKLVGRDL